MVQVPKWKKLYSTFKKMSPSDLIKKPIYLWPGKICVRKTSAKYDLCGKCIDNELASWWLALFWDDWTSLIVVLGLLQRRNF